jgi:hypothetical protein
MGEEKMVSMFDPTVNAYRQVPLSLAQKFIDSIPELQENIKSAKIEVAKDEAYANSLKTKKNE